jgi:hypothetical protein
MAVGLFGSFLIRIAELTEVGSLVIFRNYSEIYIVRDCHISVIQPLSSFITPQAHKLTAPVPQLQPKTNICTQMGFGSAALQREPAT